MSRTISKDGTTIAFEKSGQGPAVILVNGALAYRAIDGNQPLVAQLAKDFTVYNYDRRGRGESADTHPYAVAREIEDIEALINDAGGSARLFGISSGAVLALRAAAQLSSAKVPQLALYEPPFNAGDAHAKQEFAVFKQRMAELLASGKRGDALSLFFADVPPEIVAGMRQSPEWPLMEAAAPTLANDTAIMDDGAVPVSAANAANMPALVMDGGEREGQEFFHAATQALVKALPDSRYRPLTGQPHGPVDPEVLAPVLTNFFTA